MSGKGAAQRTILSNEAEARDYVFQWAEEGAQPQAMDRLERFSAMLIEENQRQNLIAKASETTLWLRHFADSAQLLAHVSRETWGRLDRESWLDLGTGAGFPGLIIAILCPEIPVKLVESRTRRVEFLQRCASELGLAQCEVLGQRLEMIKAFPASVISARAFAPLEKLLRLSAPFSTKHTAFLLPKGRSAAHELGQQHHSIRAMFHVEQSLTDRDAGIILGSRPL